MKKPSGLVLALCVFVSGCVMMSGSAVNRIKKESPLFLPAIQIAPSTSWEQRIKMAVLRQLPIGSTRPQIEAFIAQNFVHVEYAVTTRDDSRALAHVTRPHVFIRAIDDTGFPGECRVEIYLLLTPDGHLKSVLIKAREAYV